MEIVDCIFQFFFEDPQFAIVEQYTCNICNDSSYFDCVSDFSAIKKCIQCLKASIIRLFLRSFSVSSKLPSNSHFFHFSLPCRIFLLHPWIVPSSGVAGIADYLLSPFALFVALSSFNPACVISLLHASFHLRFGHPLLLFPGMSTSSILLTVCSSFILLTWSYHFSRFSVIFLSN